MNDIGVHALVWVGGWSPEERRRAIASTAEAGFDLIEIPMLHPERVDAADTRRLLEEHGVRATCSLGLSAATDVSTGEPARVAAGRELLHGALAAARDLGAPFLGGVVYGALGRYTQPPTAAGRRAAVDVVRELCDAAGEQGITIGIEVVNRYESNLLNTAEQALEFADEVGMPNCALHLDTYHMNIEERDLATPLEAAAGRVGLLHVGESHRGRLGTGSVQFDELFGAVARTGYAGPITFESFSSAVVDPELSSTLCIWRELWSDGMALAREARTFVADGLAAARAA